MVREIMDSTPPIINTITNIADEKKRG